jgi:hypothetical protein
MTYLESAALARDAEFQGRVKIAALRYASEVLMESPDTPGHIARYRWALEMIRQPDYQASQLQPLVVISPAVDAAGAAIPDAALQTAVELVVAGTL